MTHSEPPIKDEFGRPTEILDHWTDITERKRAEEELKESERRFRAIFEGAIDGILLADTETKKFRVGNKMICKMLGYSLKEVKKSKSHGYPPQGSSPLCHGAI